MPLYQTSVGIPKRAAFVDTTHDDVQLDVLVGTQAKSSNDTAHTTVTCQEKGGSACLLHLHVVGLLKALSVTHP
jgi:hypothetical protein